jgi:hypothetical protein
MFLEKKTVEKIKTHFMFTDDNTIRRMCCACWTTKATEKHSEYVILIALPREQWLHERASVLRYTYTAYLVCFTLSRKTGSIYVTQ